MTEGFLALKTAEEIFFQRSSPNGCTFRRISATWGIVCRLVGAVPVTRALKAKGGGSREGLPCPPPPPVRRPCFVPPAVARHITALQESHQQGQGQAGCSRWGKRDPGPRVQ